MLLSPEEYGAVVEHVDEIGCHNDPVLMSSTSNYADFVADLLKRGIVCMSSRLGRFFVREKSGKLRCIIDCRRTTLIFRKPPTGRCGSSATFCELELGLSEQLFSAESDVKRFCTVWVSPMT